MTRTQTIDETRHGDTRDIREKNTIVIRILRFAYHGRRVVEFMGHACSAYRQNNTITLIVNDNNSGN